MFKQTLIAASALVAASFAFQPQQAEAGTKVHVHIGLPKVGHYHGGPRHHYRGRRHHYRGHVYHARPVLRHRRVGCRQAKRLLKHRGFRHIRTRDCHGSRYVFKARRHGHWWMVKVSSYNGRVLGAHRI